MSPAVADLFWPGEERAGEVFTPASMLAAMTRVETAWLAALVHTGTAPADAAADLAGLVGPEDVQTVAARAEPGGNPVVPLLGLLRDRAPATASAWLHRGLTSQDVVDSALMLCVLEVRTRLLSELDRQVAALGRLAVEHRHTVMAGRTLTQHAVPLSFGLKAAGWLRGVLDARDQVAGIQCPVQLGGAAGTMAAAVGLARVGGASDPVATVREMTADVASSLGLTDTGPWHTTRTAVSRVGDALVTACDGWGRIANDVLVLARAEIAELAEPSGPVGRGGSSTMPHKANPVLSVLIRRTALAAPSLAAQLHVAAAESVDERSDGAWHLEWSTLATLSRRSVVAASQATELLTGLHVHQERMGATAHASAQRLLAEARALGIPVDDVTGYLGAADLVIDDVLARAQAVAS